MTTIKLQRALSTQIYDGFAALHVEGDWKIATVNLITFPSTEPDVKDERFEVILYQEIQG